MRLSEAMRSLERMFGAALCRSVKMGDQRPRTKAMDPLSQWRMVFSGKTTLEEWKERAMHDTRRAQALEENLTWSVNDELMSAEEWAEKDRLDRQAHQQYWEEKGREEGYKV